MTQESRPRGEDPPDTRRIALGKLGERLAERHLSSAGYTILARNHRTRFGELDLVARDGATLVFVEVKTRRGTRFGTGAEAVTAAKQRKLLTMAEAYLAAQPAGPLPPCRFDVVDVQLGTGTPLLRHIVDAFTA